MNDTSRDSGLNEGLYWLLFGSEACNWPSAGRDNELQVPAHLNKPYTDWKHIIKAVARFRAPKRRCPSRAKSFTLNVDNPMAPTGFWDLKRSQVHLVGPGFKVEDSLKRVRFEDLQVGLAL